MKVGLTKGTLTTASTQSIGYDGTLGDAGAFILIITEPTTTGTGTGITICIWVSDGTNEYSAFSCCGGGGTNNGAQRGRNTGGFMADENPTTLLDGTSSIDTANDEIDLVFTSGTAPTATFQYCLITFQGTDVNALAVSHDGTDQTESIGFDWDFLVATGASTTSTNTTNAALNLGLCDKNGNQGCVRIGQDDGSSQSFSAIAKQCILHNIFNDSQFEMLEVDTITTTGFNLDVQQPHSTSNNDEPGIYLAIGCDNSVEVVSTDNLTAATGTESTTVTIEPEYGIVLASLSDAGVTDLTTAASDWNFGAGSDTVSWSIGAFDLSGGVGALGDYYGLGMADIGRYRLSHAYAIAATDKTNVFEAEVDSVSSSALTWQKDTAGNDANIILLNIGADAGGGGDTPATVTDTPVSIDTVTAVRALLRSVTDTPALQDAVIGIQAFQRAVADEALSQDTVVGAKGYVRTVTDVASATDTVTATTASDTPANIGDAASSSDAVTATRTYVRFLTDEALSQDAVSALRTYVRTVTEAASSTDTVTATRTYVRGVTDTATITDTVTGTTGSTTVTLADLDKKLTVILAILLGR